MVAAATIKLVHKTKKIIESVDTGFIKIILFGSHAQGLAQKHSDIDLCIVYPAAFKDDQLDRLSSNMNIAVALQGINADLILINERRLKSDKVSPLIHQINKYGIDIAESRGKAKKTSTRVRRVD